MSLLDDVSIVVTPNGYKAGELYAVKPTFALGSELVTNGDFATDSDWTKGTGWTISGNVANFTYSTPSSLIQDLTVTSGLRYLIEYEIVSNSGVSLKGGGNSFFNVGSSIPTTVGLHSFYVTAVNSSGIDFRYLSGSGSLSVTNISVKEYTSADMDVTRATDATRVDENGLIEDVLSNVPRIDYTGGGCPHILAEPQRTNEIVNSNTSDFGIVRSARGVQETKLGIIEGYKYSYTSANPNINKNYSESTLGYKTLSFYFDATNSDYCKLNLASGGSGGAGAQVVFTPSTQTFGSIGENATYVRNSSANFESLGNNIYRVMLTTEFISYLNGTTFPIIYFGDNSNVWIGGVQVEQGSYPTSYIPTSGSTVTRNQDIFTRDGIGSLIGTEGVLFAELSAFDNDVSYRYMGLTDGTADNRVIILYYTNINTIRVLLSSGGTKYFDDTYAVTDITDFHKIAVKWKVNDFALWIDGFERATDTSGSAPIGLNTLALDQAGASNFYGKVKQLQVYDTALTDTQLAALTS